MKSELLKLLCAILIFGSFCIQGNAQTYKVKFQVDMSEAGVEDPATVGIRGDVAPLSWTETYPMKGPDKDGIYSVTIKFENVEYGTRLQYKYYHGDDQWDNDQYGEKGNRITPLCSKKQVVPFDTWNTLDNFSLEIMLESYAWDLFMSWIFEVGSAKNRGLTMHEIAQEIVDFWKWPIDKSAPLSDFMKMDRFFQEKTPFGYFEEIENSPNRIEYIVSKTWEIMQYQWSDDGVVQGVTVDDMNEMFTAMMEIYAEKAGGKYEWVDEPDHKVRIIITK